MGKKSIKENKNIYQLSREALNLTREEASEKMVYVSADKIEKIENERCSVHPDDVLAMAECYKNPHLCNYYCSNECPIGQQYIPEIKTQELSQIILATISSLNKLNNDKDRLIEIAMDGKIDETEYEDFKSINTQLKEIQLSVNALHLWIEKQIAEGLIDKNSI